MRINDDNSYQFPYDNKLQNYDVQHLQFKLRIITSYRKNSSNQNIRKFQSIHKITFAQQKC